MSNHHYRPHPQNVPGDFYVGFDCCLTCEVPTTIAPDLFAYGDEPSFGCFVKRQPESEAELARMVDVFANQELDCIRYRGDDSGIIERLDGFACDAVESPVEHAEPLPDVQIRAPRRWWQFWRRPPDV